MLGVALAAALVGQPHIRQRTAETVNGLGIAHSISTVPALAEALRLTPEEWEALPPAARRDVASQGRRPVAEEVPA